MKHHEVSGLHIGWADLYIYELASLVPEFFSPPWSLITMLDSDANVVRAVGNLVFPKFPNARALDDSILASNEDITRIMDEPGIFSHFDEVYVIHGIPQETVKQHFTRDAADFGESVSKEFLECFQRLRAVRFVADGDGLNFVCEDAQLLPRIAQAESAVEAAADIKGRED